MSDLDTLRPEVREALAIMDRDCPETIDWQRTAWGIIRAELLRLAGENAQLRESALGGYEDGWHALRNERDVLKAELAALRARIAEAPFVSVRVDDDKHVSLGARSHPKDFAHLHGRRARLVREDGDD